jgi:formylglycine-generating enzyme required for sulfatase activity
VRERREHDQIARGRRDQLAEQIATRIGTAAIAAIFGACGYDASFSNCTILCSADTGCPNGFMCGAEGLCRSDQETATCSFASCARLAAKCGPDGNDDCCAGSVVPGGTFYRSYDLAADGMYSSMSYPATVSSFVLDKYEVTVGRFRQFVNAGMGTQASPPPTSAGARTLIGIPDQGGWDSAWNPSLVADTAGLLAAVKCNTTYQTWTDMSGANESLPANCVTWYEAFAFCTWDGGFLPTEAEWNYAAAGGTEQRAYPWSNPSLSLTIDCSYANHRTGSGAFCVNPPNGFVNRVGSESPNGDGTWGHSDLGGNVWEWTLDWYNATYLVPSSDGANLSAGSRRVIRGGSWYSGATYLRTANRDLDAAMPRADNVGLRCARAL